MGSCLVLWYELNNACRHLLLGQIWKGCTSRCRVDAFYYRYVRMETSLGGGLGNYPLLFD